ncbi:hypothetical protein WN55_01528 [Dufourea novaeangliae]|uniref:Uncharacterized protein n=1 Tax=Dufourea novaeangliae TaxID=178035 RepID=A0A154PG37_DUFNO|nr:hypothetical protein WN55_01528 [Dufourea novaeangliae]
MKSPVTSLPGAAGGDVRYTIQPQFRASYLRTNNEGVVSATRTLKTTFCSVRLGDVWFRCECKKRRKKKMNPVKLR